MPLTSVSGSYRYLFLYDVCEEIRLDDLRARLGLEQARRSPSFRHPAPEYVRFQKAPVIEHLESFALPSSERIDGRMKYYDFGVVSVEYQINFELSWSDLVLAANRCSADQQMNRQAAAAVDERVKRFIDVMVKPYNAKLNEDYSIIHIEQKTLPDGRQYTAANLLDDHADAIAMLVRGEIAPLSKEERAEILGSSMSYYPNDLAVVGWSAALLYDAAESAEPTIQILEYANSQLLEFRHYDEQLTQLLADTYDLLEQKRGYFARWKLASEAERLNTILLDVRELTERVDNSIKFLSDMFSARFYKLAATKVGVPDYRKLVDDKLKTAGELYQSMIESFNQGRAFVLELVVVIILIIDLFFLFRGKS